ncbi:MAG: hypothetical protein JSV66_07875 [Trueperaceae bacterium]|nr:MAG: hypothetical protein JSV66_07875 [Trueperaceae bacterium]
MYLLRTTLLVLSIVLLFGGMWFVVRHRSLITSATTGDFCPYRCMEDPQCIEALNAEELLHEPDQSLCNGICSALKRIERESALERARLGLEEQLPVHPCLEPLKALRLSSR